ncbi:substrate-binding periplasmic protein [Pseudoalteromonas tunicata]|jgi:polar amino acid transport system substrate-binding protein|uniref:Putative ABC transporter, periplasmic substrate-binding protein n=1 Tax=Pseudoalteromonas tunicata D2 TaxID=87626 RepID=A4C3R4_9GAMM|nr:transporter substrate-binding domain-containing protein [Pseudoalteromonas tunicata]ATC96524.1 hypothetical protein PTUN_b0054 [Pseudoalteromonas tunicata]AXT33392.1 ABC transporter substrate-binding protein [Pseudoalteromonas tunicata]EAR30196.1 putative ABC transporter, periplasmic substrate-binding protein [Pseudoalteromonas tunicata D2]MDP4985495.1 transporter substrate-binding domain-containing protein [Pseudoalteromonas tunicata]MDP5214487.1 transporter substrate-binding domain-contai
MIKLLFIPTLFFVVSITFKVFADPVTLQVVTEEWPPFNYTNDQGQIVGRSTDVIKAVLAEAKIDYTLNSYPWGRALHIAQTQPNVIIYSIYRTEERKNQYQWVCPLIPAVKIFVYRLRSRPDIKIKNISEAVKYRTGSNKNDSSHKYLLDHGFEVGVNLDLTNDSAATIRKFVAGRLDFLMQTEYSMITQLESLGLNYDHVEKLFPIKEYDFGAPCLAFSLGTAKELVERVKTIVLAYPHNETKTQN